MAASTTLDGDDGLGKVSELRTLPFSSDRPKAALDSILVGADLRLTEAAIARQE